ncbi:hypothetical protein R1sor_010000 [Riccia sorocarpa]|uniref:Uncharacterized protein n=1 Tax=Riccia sorocarpa TaxID=122646 RepID=A0ABD3I045_9MARC
MVAISEALWKRPGVIVSTGSLRTCRDKTLPRVECRQILPLWDNAEFRRLRQNGKAFWGVGLATERKFNRLGYGKVSRLHGVVSALALEGEGESGSSRNVGEWLRRKIEERRRGEQPVGESVMRMVATATAAPIAQYIDSPFTALHALDPRVKQAWLVALVVLPARAHISVRVGMVGLLILATICSLPRRIWQDQLGRMFLLSGFLFVLTALGTDGVPPVVQPRTPPASLEGLPEILPSFSGYSYVVMKLGPLLLTRKGLSLASATSCLSFTVLQSATLCLTTTTPEQLAAGLRWYLSPLSRWGAPVGESILTLLLSLRFIGLVFDEVRNIALAVVARGVQWKLLKPLETVDTLLTLCGRLFKNLLNHAEKISEAMVARGFRGNASDHRIYFLNKFSITTVDRVAILGLVVLVALTTYAEMVLVV